MDFTARNLIYTVICRCIGQTYIGETVCLRARANTHRSNSKSLDRASIEVSRHLYRCGQGFKMCPMVKVREECKMVRLVVEDSLIKLLKPDLNTDKRNLLHLKLMD